MLYTLARVLEGRRPPISIPQTATVGEALRLMTENHVGQLPIVDEDGLLAGIVSQQAILSLTYYAGGSVSLLDLPLSHCQETATALTVDDDLLTAVEALRRRDTYAVVVTREDHPAGILTGKDMTQFLRSLFEGVLLVESVELTLRDAITTAYPDEAALDQALMAAFGPSRYDAHRPARSFDFMSFGDNIRFVCDQDNWSDFETAFGPKRLFGALMERVRKVRNELAHFEARPDGLELDALRRINQWLATRPAQAAAAPHADDPAATAVEPAGQAGG